MGDKRGGLGQEGCVFGDHPGAEDLVVAGQGADAERAGLEDDATEVLDVGDVDQ